MRVRVRVRVSVFLSVCVCESTVSTERKRTHTSLTPTYCNNALQHHTATTCLRVWQAGTLDNDGRPVEMEVIASSVDAAEQYSKLGG